MVNTNALGASVVRKGKVLHELLMHRGLFKVIAYGGERRAEVLIGEPVPLTEGTRAWNLFEAGMLLYTILRPQGRRGACIFHLASDSAVLAPLDPMFRERYEAYCTAGIGPHLVPEGPLVGIDRPRRGRCLHCPRCAEQLQAGACEHHPCRSGQRCPRRHGVLAEQLLALALKPMQVLNPAHRVRPQPGRGRLAWLLQLVTSDEGVHGMLLLDRLCS